MEPSPIQPPLCVDLDGTLIDTDSLHEQIVWFLTHRLWRSWQLFLWVLRGKAYLKKRLAEVTSVRMDLLPVCAELVEFLRQEHALGRQLILVTAADEKTAAAAAARFGFFSSILASDGVNNFKGPAKVKRLTELFGVRGFDYVGNSSDDLIVWAGARQAYVVNAPDAVEKRARQVDNVTRVFQTHSSRLAKLKRTLRVHQWPKNLLLIVPVLTSHRLRDWQALLHSGLGFCSFCCCASAVYVLNDLHDLDADRLHATKKNRPFASGGMPLAAGLLLVPVLLAFALCFASPLPPLFTAYIAIYFCTSAAYSWHLKSKLLVDVFVLAGLYSIRIIAGNAATGIVYSSWLMGFSVFLFLSLALLKRYIELRRLIKAGGTIVGGRGYHADDLSSVFTMGAVSGYIAALVLALYINSEDVRFLYHHPALVLFICPILLYWVTRIWFLASRDQLDDDPVLFAVKDKASYLCGALVLLVIWLAA
jgi:4-hydroxybenzoate polyprenyltransferase/phosphoserine phosphatase